MLAVVELVFSGASLTVDDDLIIADQLGRELSRRQVMLVTAESCTGGVLAEILTRIPGASAWFERGYITYSNDAKHECLGVPWQTLERFGAVSEEAAAEMARGALVRSRARLSVAVTGIAGPGGGSADKPAGTVCFAWLYRHHPLRHMVRILSGDRQSVRRQACRIALNGCLQMLNGDPAQEFGASSIKID